MKQTIVAVITMFGISVAQLPYAQAQGNDNGPGNPTLLKAIQDLQTSSSAGISTVLQAIQNLQNSMTTAIAAVLQAIQSVQTSVTNVQNSVDAISPSAQSNVRFTPPIAVVGPEFAVCFVTNVSSQARNVDAVLLDRLGTTIEHFAVTMQPGTATNPVVHQAVGPGDFYHCKFTVTNGSRTDIRAAIIDSADTPGTRDVYISAE